MIEPVFNLPPEGESWPHAWLVVGDMVISVTQEGAVPPEQWDPFLADLGSKSVNRVLGLAVGSITINGKQRRGAVMAMKEKQVAAVVESSVARGIVTAFGWMGLRLKAYDWASLTDAFTYLDSPELTPEEGVELVRQLLVAAKAPTLEELGGAHAPL